MDTVASTLDWLGTTAFRWSALAFLLVNGAAVLGFVVTKNRAFVNQWTSKLVFTNALLVGTGIGIPVLTKAATVVVQVVGATTGHPLNHSSTK